jgi:uncharacterized protein YggE
MKPWIIPTTLVGGIALGAAALAVAVTAGPDSSARPASAAAATDPPSGSPTSTPVGATRTITVMGEGIVKGKPDVMTINLGVQTRDTSANGALNQANEKATQLIATLKAAGVQSDDITTTDVSIYPQYDSAGQHVVGYNASNQVVARFKDLTKAGEVIDAAAGAVGDAITLGGVSFSIDDTGALKQQARVGAVNAAKAQADQLAAAAGTKVGRVLTINETSVALPYPQYYAAAPTADKAASTPIEPGTQQVSLNVTVVYELVD